MAEKNVNANSAIHTLEELGVISGDDAHTCLVTQEEYAQKFKEGNSDAFTNLLAISYAEYTREEKADRDESIPEKQTARKKFLLRLSLNMMKFRKCHRSMNTTPMKIIRSRKMLRSTRTIRQMNCQKTLIVT